MYKIVIESTLEALKKTLSDEKQAEKAISYLDPLCASPMQNYTEYLTKLFDVQDKSLSFRAAVDTLDHIMDRKLTGREAASAVGVISERLSHFSDKALSSLLLQLLESLEAKTKHDGTVFEVLARCVARLGSKEQAEVEFDNDSLSTSEFRRTVVSRIIASNWSASYAVNLLGAMKDLTLSDEEQRQMVEKGIFMMGIVEFSILPSLVYQLLLFQPKNKGELVVKLATFFDTHEETFRADAEKVALLRQIEGTVLLHVDVALKQDATMATTFIKAVQKDSFAPSPFMLAFLLALSRSPRHQEAIMKILMQFVTSSVQKDVASSNHAWAEVAKKKGARQVDSLSKLLSETVARAKHGWQVILLPLVSLGFTCMETRVTKGKAICDALRAVGSDLLQQLFEKHESVHSEILSLLLGRIATTAAEAPAFIELLSRLISKYTHQVLESELKLREAFEYLTYLKPNVAELLVEAILPLVSRSKPFQDHLMIVFRKAMFRGDLQSRLTAVGGFARWVSKIALDPSLASDIIGFLSRGLTQQLPVRMVVYGCLEDVLVRQKDAYRTILDVLSEQLSRYFPEGSKVVSLQKCFDGEGISESIGTLLVTSFRCASHCLSTLDHTSKSRAKAELLLKRVKAMVDVISEAELEEFGLDKSTDFGGDSDLGKHNIACGALMLSLYVACMEIASSSETISGNDATKILALFKKHSELYEIIAGGGGDEDGDGGSKKRKKPSAAAAAAGNGGASSKKALQLPISYIFHPPYMVNLFGSFAKVQQDAVSQRFRDDKVFHSWVCSQLLAVLDDQERLTVDFCRRIGPLIMSEYKRDSGATNAVLADAMLKVVTYVDKHLSEVDLSHFLRAANPIDRTRPDASSQDCIKDQLRSILAFVPPLLINKSYKEMLVIFSLADILVNRLKPENTNDLSNLMSKLLAEELDHVVSCKSLATLYLDLCTKNGRVAQGASDIIQSIQGLLGVDEEAPTGQVDLKVVSEKTWQVLGVLTLDVAEKQLAELDWAMAVIKGNEASVEFDQEQLRKAAYGRLQIILSILDGLACVNLPWCPVSEMVLKQSTHLFKSLVALTKTFTQQKHVPSEDFVEVVKQCGQLIGHLYDLVERLSARANSDEEEVEQDGDKGKKNNKSKKLKIAQKARAKREEKIQPALVYEIERLETSLIRYQKQCRVTLMLSWRRSAERDFKIQQKKVHSIVQKRDRAVDAEVEDESLPVKKTKAQD